MFRPLLLPRLLPLILLAGRTVALGGKSFFVSSPLDFANKNYALLTMCQPRGKIPLNVSLYLNPFQENQRIAFHRADIPLEVSSEVRNVTQVTVEAASWPVSLNIRQITFRLGQSLLKLVLNANCDGDEKYWTAPDMVSSWGRFVDCSEMDVYCDSREDEITECDRLFTYHVIWRNGVDRYD